MLLTGPRSGEAFGLKHEPGLLVENVDLRGKRITFLDIKKQERSRDPPVYASS